MLREEFVYIPGSRRDAATLIAHADTVFDSVGSHRVIYIEETGIIRSEECGAGIGADDRAGCALLWLLKDSGHNVLLIGYEERGQPSAHFLAANHPDILREIQSSSFMVEFDRRTSDAYRVYDIPVTAEFRAYVEKETGFNEREKGGITDICVLCTDGCCGVNVSVGYYNAHSPDEYIVVSE